MSVTGAPGITIPKFLLVEDDPDDAALTRRALERAHIGNELAVVDTGEAALEILYAQALGEREQVGLILLDLGLPKIDGREVLRRIWSDRRLRQIPIIVLTGSATEEDMLKSYKSGAVGFLRKPVDVDRLLRAVGDLPNYRLFITKVSGDA